MTEFINRLRSLYAIDRHLLPELSEAEWIAFRTNPPRYLIYASDEQAAAIFREIEKRQ
jgi:hypothetical protein